MTELRDWYLGALGIVRYVPRTGGDSDPQALVESLADEDSSYADGEALSPAVKGTKQDSQAATAALRQVLVQDDVSRPAGGVGSASEKSSKADISSATSEQGITATAEDAEEMAPFRLAFWQSASSTVVLSALPPGARPSPGQQEMLTNLLKAIDQLPEGLSPPEWIDWPLARQPSISVASAREFVETFLEVKHKLQPFSTVLLMGCGDLTLDDNKEKDQQRALRCSATGLVTHSLQAMEQNPALKRETWEAIRHLAEK